jgi:hypothetical protein
MANRSDRKIKNILLEPGIQLRYTYYLMALALTPMIMLMGYTTIELYKMKSMLTLMSQVPPQVLDFFGTTFTHVSLGFAVALVFNWVMIVYGTLAISHRFVGPIYVINQYISSLLKNEPFRDRELRREDELKKTWDLLRELGKKYQDSSKV